MIELLKEETKENNEEIFYNLCPVYVYFLKCFCIR